MDTKIMRVVNMS